jgi:hypothetical protein
MNISTRTIFFRLYAIFFILVSPVIIIYSLGYNFDITKGNLQKNLLLSIKTIPRGAEISTNNSRKYTSPVEIRLTTTTPQEFKISYTDFFDENFTVWTGLKQNSSFILDNIVLLPKKSSNIHTLEETEKFLTFLPKNRYLLSKNNLLYMQGYSPLSISDLVPVGAVGIDKNNISKGQWKALDDNTIYNQSQKLLLWLNSDITTWQVDLINNTIPDVYEVKSIGNNKLAVLDSKGNLYIYYPLTKTVQFVDSGYLGLDTDQETDTLWLMKTNGLYKISFDFFQNSDDFFGNLEKPFINIIPEYRDTQILKVKPNFKGFSVFGGSYLWYAQDIDRDKPNLLSKNVKQTSNTKNAVIYLDSNGQVLMYNYLFDFEKKLAHIDKPDDNTLLYYNQDMQRLFIYSPNLTKSIWINSDNNTQNIIKHSVIDWITDSQCQQYIDARVQVCYKDGILQKYQNNYRN